MKWNATHILLLTSALAVAGLVFFQLKWINHSRQLSEQIFNQRVCMALCSTVEHYGGGANCGQGACAASCQPETSVPGHFPVSFVTDSAFLNDLRQSLDFYQIKLDFKIDLDSAQQVGVFCGENQPCKVVLPATTEAGERFVSLEFPNKTAFVLGDMNFMVLATMLILLFTIAVLLFANWSLRKQKQLLHANVDFFNNMAHEFRTPLTNMSLAGNLLLKKNAELRDNRLFGIMQQEGSRLQEQVERVLQLASLDKGDFALKKERLPLQALLRSVCDELLIQLEEKQATVHLEAVPAEMVVWGDSRQLSNLFRNLLDNALKYSHLQPEISITAKEHDRGVMISVQDNGVGIPAAQCNLIFEKFQRANTRTENESGGIQTQRGFGLGLAYVKQIAALHKGFVKVFSEPNHGSRFDVYLPTPK
jgi:signal transduction histidine kinase